MADDAIDETPPSPSPSVNPPPPPPPPPLSQSQYDNIMDALRRVESAQNAPTLHPLSSISRVDVHLRDLATVAPGTDSDIRVRVIQPERGPDPTKFGKADWWAVWFRNKPPEFMETYCDAMREGYDLFRSELSEGRNPLADNLAGRFGGEEDGSRTRLEHASADQSLSGVVGAANTGQSVLGGRGGGGINEGMPGNASGSGGSTGRTPAAHETGGVREDHSIRDEGMQDENNNRNPQPPPPSTEPPQTNLTTIMVAPPESTNPQDEDNNRNARPLPSTDPTGTSNRRRATPNLPVDQSRAEVDKQADKLKLMDAVRSGTNDVVSAIAQDIERKHAAAASGPSTKEKQQKIDAARSMGPPPAPNPRQSPSKDQEPQEKKTQSEATVAATASKVSTGRQNRVQSEASPATSSAPTGQANPRTSSATTTVPSTSRPRRGSSADIPRTGRTLRAQSVELSAVPEEERIVMESSHLRGNRSARWDIVVEDVPVEQEDILATERRLKRELREREASISADTKRTASTAGVESSSGRRTKKAKLHNPPEAQAEPADDGGGGGDDDDHDSKVDRNQRALNDKVRRESLKRAILVDLQNGKGSRENYNTTMKRHRRTPQGTEVQESEFRGAIDELVEEGRVLLSGTGSKKYLQISPIDNDNNGNDLSEEGEEGDNNSDAVEADSKQSSSEDGIEAKSPGQAHQYGKRSRTIQKYCNSRQPTKGHGRRFKHATAWASPSVGAGGNNERASKPDLSGGTGLQGEVDDGELQTDQLPAKQITRTGQQNADVKRDSNRQQQQPEPTPAKPTRKRKAKADDTALSEEDDEDVDDDQPPKKRKTRKTTKASTRKDR